MGAGAFAANTLQWGFGASSAAFGGAFGGATSGALGTGLAGGTWADVGRSALTGGISGAVGGAVGVHAGSQSANGWTAFGGTMTGTAAGTGTGIGFGWAAWGQDPTWQSAGTAFASAFAGTIASSALSKGYQAAIEADTAGEAAGEAAGRSARRAAEAVGRQNNEIAMARLAAAIDAYDAGHMLADNTVDPRQLEIIKQNVEAVRQAEWELFYAVAGGKLVKMAWGALKAWRAARVAATLKICFVAGTLVATPAGPTPIEELQVGDRVETVPGGEATAVDSSWRVVKVTLADEHDTDHLFDVDLLRPPEWFDAHDVTSPGDSVFLELEEIGVAGFGVIESIQDAPEIEDSAGRVVLMTVSHVNSEVYELSFEGVVEKLRPTGAHPLYSLDRDAWVRVQDLVVGERVQTAEGAVSVAALERVRGEHRVYNIEVEEAHEYLVTKERVRAHNTCFTPAGRAITEHAKESLIRHKFKNLGQIDEIISGARYTTEQADGAMVFIQQVGRGGKATYNLVIEGAEGIVTGMRGLSKEAVRALGRNNAWESLPF